MVSFSHSPRTGSINDQDEPAKKVSALLLRKLYQWEKIEEENGYLKGEAWGSGELTRKL